MADSPYLKKKLTTFVAEWIARICVNRQRGEFGDVLSPFLARFFFFQHIHKHH